MHDDYDRSSQWLIRHFAGAILRLGGLTTVRSWRVMSPELVQPRQRPDGFLEYWVAGSDEPRPCIVEVATYPERRVTEQVSRDVMLALLETRQVPEALVLVLRPKHRLRVPKTVRFKTASGQTAISFAWRVVELWRVPAGDLLASDDIGMVPWIPLCAIDGPPEPVLRECRRRIDAAAPEPERENMLTVCQVLAGLRYNTADLTPIFGGTPAMIKSPLLDEIDAESRSEMLVRFLAARFGSKAEELGGTMISVRGRRRFNDLADWAFRCPDLDAFRQRLDDTLRSCAQDELDPA